MKESKSLEKLEKMVNKWANTIRLIGIILGMVSAVAAVSYRSNTEGFWDTFTVSLLVIFVSGVIMTFIGEIFYRILLKYGNVTHRKFYFKGEE